MNYEGCIVKQDYLPADTQAEMLPKTIIRKCCPHKSCGNTRLYLVVDNSDPDGILYRYARESNDDWYYATWNLDKLINFLNDRYYWPVDDELFDKLLDIRLEDDDS